MNLKMKNICVLSFFISTLAQAETCSGRCELKEDFQGSQLGVVTWTFENCEREWHDHFMIHEKIGDYQVDLYGVPGEINAINLSHEETQSRASLNTSWRPFWQKTDFIPIIQLSANKKSASLICRTDKVHPPEEEISK